MQFGYENLEVWKKAVDFAVQVRNDVEKISTDRKHYWLLEQIEASSTSISMNTAEGKGRGIPKRQNKMLFALSLDL